MEQQLRERIAALAASVKGNMPLIEVEKVYGIPGSTFQRALKQHGTPTATTMVKLCRAAGLSQRKLYSLIMEDDGDQ